MLRNTKLQLLVTYFSVIEVSCNTNRDGSKGVYQDENGSSKNLIVKTLPCIVPFTTSKNCFIVYKLGTALI